MINDTQALKESPIACDMTAIKPDRRERHIATGREVFRAVTEIMELPDGYAFRLADEPNMLMKKAEFISLEKLCCPFLGFVIEIKPEGGAVWLRLIDHHTGKPSCLQQCRCRLLLSSPSR